MNARFIFNITITILCSILWLTTKAGEIKESVEGNRLLSEGALLYKQGNTPKAAKLWEQALKHFRFDLGENHFQTIRTTQVLATTYYYLQQYDKALPLNEFAFNARRIQFGEDNLDTLNSMNNLALIYREIGEYEKALELHLKTLAGRRVKLGEDSRETLQSMNNVTVLYRDLGQYEEALKWAQKTWERRKDKFGEYDRETLRSMNNLAAIYTNLEQYKKAQEWSEKTLNLMRTKFGENGEEALYAMGNLAIAYSDLGRYKEALELEEEIVRIRRSNYKDGIDVHPDMLRSLNNLAVSYIDTRQNNKAFPLISEIFSATEKIRMMPNLSQEQRQSLFASYSSDYQYYAGLYAKSKRIEEAFNIADLSKARTLAENINFKSTKFTTLKPATVADAKQLLRESEVFISYLVDNKERMQVFVLQANGTVNWVDLGKFPDYTKAIANYRELIRNKASITELEKQQKYWHKKLIAPILPLIKDANHWIISPDKDLALFPLDTLSDVINHNVSLVQSFTVYSLLKQREIEYSKIQYSEELLAMGNPVYSEGWTPERGEEEKSIISYPSLAAEQYAMNQKLWRNLLASGYELNSIAKMFNHSKNYQGLDASEKNLQDMNASGQLKNYRYLLFSTHGYLAQHAALSALVLSRKDNPEGIDGYVTASEWPLYDLRSDLTVLSACDTGTGKTQAGESVMGLPYALFVAGNKNTLLTLWKVDDEATAYFMERFFSRLKSGTSQHEALSQTKQEFVKETAWKHPRFWAAFVLYGV